MRLARMTRAAAAAADADMPTKGDGLYGSLGLGGGARPVYDGSSDEKIRVLPNLNLFYGDVLFLTGMMAGANTAWEAVARAKASMCKKPWPTPVRAKPPRQRVMRRAVMPG